MLRVIHDLSKRTSTYAAIGHAANKGTAAVALSAGGSVGAGMAQHGFITGIKHSFRYVGDPAHLRRKIKPAGGSAGS